MTSNNKPLSSRVVAFCKNSLATSYQVSIIVLKFIVPLYILAEIVYYYNLLSYIAFIIAPLADLLSLPPESAIVIISGMFLNLYAAIAFAAPLDLSPKEWTILGMYLCVCHSLIPELAIMKKIGITVRYALTLRIAVGMLLAFGITLIPEHYFTPLSMHLDWTKEAYTAFLPMLQNAIIQSMKLAITIIILVSLIILAIDMLKATPWLQNSQKNVSKISAMIIGILLGITYGGGVLINEARNQTMDKTEIFYVGTFLMVCHAIIEDSLLFIIFGANWWMLIFIRLIAAIIISYLLFYLYKKYHTRPI